MANLAKLLVHLCGALTVNIVLSRSRAKTYHAGWLRDGFAFICGKYQVITK